MKILLISGNAEMARQVADLTLHAVPEAELTVEATADAGLAMVATNNFHVLIFEITQANAAGAEESAAASEERIVGCERFGGALALPVGADVGPQPEAIAPQSPRRSATEGFRFTH